MTGFNHGMTGAMIALAVRQPLWAVPFSFISHFVCDAIPHYGNPDKPLFTRRFNIMLLADFLFALTLMVILAIVFPEFKWLIWACMVAAAIPDLASAYYRLYQEHIKKRSLEDIKIDPLYQFHWDIQWSETPRGIYVEIFWFILMAFLIFYMNRTLLSPPV